MQGKPSIWIVYEAVSYKQCARLDSLRFSELGGIAEDVLSGLGPPNSGLPSIRMTPINVDTCTCCFSRNKSCPKHFIMSDDMPPSSAFHVRGEVLPAFSECHAEMVLQTVFSIQ